MAWAGLLAFLAAAGPVSSPTKQTPTRIVSLVPHATEILFALGAGDRVAGVSDGCLWPAEARQKPHLGGVFDVKIDEIAALKPDLVLLTKSHLLHRRPLAERGIPTKTIETNSINEAFVTIQDLALLVGRYEAGRKMILQMVDELNALYQKNSRMKRRRALLCVGHEREALKRIFVAAPNNYLGEILSVAGADNVAALPPGEYGIVLPMSREEIVQAKPEIIVDLLTAEEPSDAERQRIEGLWRDLFATEAEPPRRIYALYDPYLPVPGMRIADSIRKLTRLIHYDE